MVRKNALPLLLLGLTLGVSACGSDTNSSSASGVSGGAVRTTDENAGEVVTPPFEVRGDAAGLMLVWYDEEGPHTATSRSAVPAERRAEVRVQSLSLDEAGDDTESVYVADLRSADEHGDYTVRRMSRSSFDGIIDAYRAAARTESETALATGADVVIYGASWCGACRQAESFLRARGIAFVERDVEEDPTAAADMRSAAAAAGVRVNGIPVIDFRGRIILGFDRDALEEAIRETTPGRSGITI